MTRRLIGVLLGLLVCRGAVAGEHYVLKFATLAPRGTSWMIVLSQWAKIVHARSDGRLEIKLYPGGVAGDEPDVITKMRFGQLQGAALTGRGIGEIYFPARILELPFLFRNYAEVDYVRARIMPRLRAGFRKNGFALIGWGEVGPVRLFSSKPVRTLQDMKKLRIWLWQGDPLARAFFSAAGLSPIPLSITDVYTSLSTGLINTVYAPPLGAIAMQWFTQTKYVSGFPMADAVAALVVRGRFYDRLPSDLQRILSETGKAAGQRLIAVSREDNVRSLRTLRKYGLKFGPGWAHVDRRQFFTLRDRVIAELEHRGLIPAALVRRVQDALHRYRAAHPGDGKPGAYFAPGAGVPALR